ncbi:Dps family protein [Streptococcus loxodontisalivarius]|uniref:Starvation-inducible DNA-binding protein n=1 Tax=Streptococcus loxodontisalivarius TaxID=1349415 RepID=A0ABS2PRI9_9STRE|nr:Dps family protein [Streptococcus loxodontisalivarius]MBM7642605.1 starvation-inducible DNA-binding protein [Streptococcus loxodontisalivarius]
MTPVISVELQETQVKNYVKTKVILNQAVADISVAASIIHQTHWYMRGAGFMYLHPKMDELMDSLNDTLDEMSERLITIGGAPFSTLKEFSEQSNLEEKPGTYETSMEDRLANLVDVYKYLASLFQTGLNITDEEGDNPSNDLFSDALAETEKTIWMLQAEIGQAPGLR